MYIVRAYATNAIGTGYGSSNTFTTLNNTPVLPTVITTAPSNITTTTAQTGGNVTSDGGAGVTDKGIIYSSVLDPTLTNYPDGAVIPNGTGTGSFIVALTGLTPNTPYYVRAYATNSVGTGYGSSAILTTKVNKPTLISPVNNGTSIPVNGLLTWSPVSGAVDYLIKLSVDVNFGSTVLDISGNASINQNYTGLLVNQVYYWKVAANNANGQGDWSDIWSFSTVDPSSVGEANVQMGINLSCNPNPISTDANFSLYIPVSSRITLKVFNSLGITIETIINKTMESGTYNINWNPSMINLPDGIYFCELISGNHKIIIPVFYLKN